MTVAIEKEPLVATSTNVPHRRNSIGSSMPVSPRKPRRQERRMSLSQPISFCELISKRSATTRRKSCIQSSPPHQRKNVTFAVNVHSDRVWCTVKSVKKSPRASHKNLWFTAEECKSFIYQSMMEAADILSKEGEYAKSLNDLFQGLLQQNIEDTEIQEIIDQFSQCPAIHRGLETHILAHAKEFSLKHRQSVLKAQNKAREHGQHNSTKGELHICKESIKYSTVSQLMSALIANYDEKEAKRVHYEESMSVTTTSTDCSTVTSGS